MKRLTFSPTFLIDSLNVCSSYSEVCASLIKTKVLNLREREREIKCHKIITWYVSHLVSLLKFNGFEVL